MTKKEMAEEIKVCEERLKYLREKLNEPEHSGNRWEPKLGESYFSITSCGTIFTDKYDGVEEEGDMYAIGNVFPTLEDAEFELERRKVLAELSAFAEGKDAVWNIFHEHWAMHYDYSTKSIGIVSHKVIKYPGLYFSSEEIGKAAIQAVGENRIKKYYLGV